jgi:hypothetical protein
MGHGGKQILINSRRDTLGLIIYGRGANLPSTRETTSISNNSGGVQVFQDAETTEFIQLAHPMARSLPHQASLSLTSTFPQAHYSQARQSRISTIPQQLLRHRRMRPLRRTPQRRIPPLIRRIDPHALRPQKPHRRQIPTRRSLQQRRPEMIIRASDIRPALQKQCDDVCPLAQHCLVQRGLAVLVIYGFDGGAVV